MENLASYIDHTLLKPEASAPEVRQLCREAREYGFASVCVNSCRVALAAAELTGSSVAVCAVVGFPLGAMDPQAKAFEAKKALQAGAREIDMVINIGALKDRAYDVVEEDIRKVKQECGSRLLKVILETCLLSKEEILRACEMAGRAGADYVKTSTGFSKGGSHPGRCGPSCGVPWDPPWE